MQFFAPNLSVLFLTLFQLRIETASLPKWRKKTHRWLWQRRKSWGLEGNVWRRKIFFEIIRSSFYEAIVIVNLLFSQQSCDCAPLICKKISCISELLHRTLHVGCHVAGLFIQHSCNYLNCVLALHLAVGKNNSDPLAKTFDQNQKCLDLRTLLWQCKISTPF